MASKKHEAVLHRVRELMDGLDEDTTTLSKPHDDGPCADSGCTDRLSSILRGVGIWTSSCGVMRDGWTLATNRET